MAGPTSTLLLALAGLVACQAPGRPREAGVPVPAVGDRDAELVGDCGRNNSCAPSEDQTL